MSKIGNAVLGIEEDLQNGYSVVETAKRNGVPASMVEDVYSGIYTEPSESDYGPNESDYDEYVQMQQDVGC